jgi:hypothetical protein
MMFEWFKKRKTKLSDQPHASRPSVGRGHIHIPGLGKLWRDGSGSYVSAPISVKVLSGERCEISVDGYDEDENQEEFHVAIANFLAIEPPVLDAAEPYIFQYYQDCSSYVPELTIRSPEDVWRHISFGDPTVSRDLFGDRGIYVSIECECDWEEEHGLQIVFRNGAEVNKVGPYDGHLTNSAAFADPSLQDVVYVRL